MVVDMRNGKREWLSQTGAGVSDYVLCLYSIANYL
jgi:hypothetical protein